jgi:hypothetical protein
MTAKKYVFETRRLRNVKFRWIIESSSIAIK